MAGASIVANQPTGAGAGSAGVARNDLWQGQAVNLVSALSGNDSFLWELLSSPAGSSSTLSTPTSSSSGFTPDSTGTYRVRLTTNNGGPGNVQTRVYRVRYDNLGALTNRGWALPGVGEVLGEANYGGNTRGWAETMEFIFADLESVIDDVESGTNAYTSTTADFTQPAVNSNVTVSVGNSEWIAVGQVLYVENGGYYQTISKPTTTSVTLKNLGYTGNASPSTNISDPATVSPAGLKGVDGTDGTDGENGTNGYDAFTGTTDDATVPSVNSNVTLEVVQTFWMVVDIIVFIESAGYYQVVTVDDDTHVTVKNLGYPGNASPAATIPSDSLVIPAGLRGATGATGSAGSNGVNAFTTTTADFTQPAIGSTVVAAVSNSSWISIGQQLFITNGGYYLVTARDNDSQVTVKNLGYPDNAVAGASVGTSSKVSPAGPLYSHLTPTDSDTVIRWSLDESAAPFANSGTGGSLDLTVGSGTFETKLASPLGRCVGTGSDANVLTSGNTSVGTGTSTLTMSIWVYLTAVSGAEKAIFAKEYANDGTHNVPFNTMAIVQSGSGGWFVRVATGLGSFSVSISAFPYLLPIYKWTLLALTYDGTTLKAYINGKLCGTQAVTSTLDYGTNGPYGVGGYANGTVNGSVGLFDDARVENVVRSEDYLLAMYKRGMGWIDIST